MIDLRGWIAIARTCRHCGGPLFVVNALTAGRSYNPGRLSRLRYGAEA